MKNKEELANAASRIKSALERMKIELERQRPGPLLAMPSLSHAGGEGSDFLVFLKSLLSDPDPFVFNLRADLAHPTPDHIDKKKMDLAEPCFCVKWGIQCLAPRLGPDKFVGVYFVSATQPHRRCLEHP